MKTGEVKFKPIVSNFLKQNCFRSESRPLFVDLEKTKSQPLSFAQFDIKKNDDGSGVAYETNTYDYPITKEFVNSFASSCDFKADLQSNLNRPAPAANMVDVRDIQKTFQGDMSDFRARLSALEAEYVASKNKVLLDPQPDTVDKIIDSEVKK